MTRNIKTKHIGKVFRYTTASGVTRTAKCKTIEYHQGLRKWLFIGVSPFGNTVRLSMDEVMF